MRTLSKSKIPKLIKVEEMLYIVQHCVRFFAFLLLLTTLSSCDWLVPSSKEEFSSTPSTYKVEPGVIDEASGLAPSRNFGGYLWTINDSGAPAELILMKEDATQMKKYTIPGAVNKDWEDIATGPGPAANVNYIYIGDIGGNTNPSEEIKTIYRVKELGSVESGFTSGDVEAIHYRYADGPRDAETLLLDPRTKDIYIVSKNLNQDQLYVLPYPQAVGTVNTAALLGNIKTDNKGNLLNISTAGDISSDGSEIVIRNYHSIYYWKRGKSETVAEALSKPALKSLPYFPEPQGESVCFDRNANGYYTISEKASANYVNLYYYKRK